MTNAEPKDVVIFFGGWYWDGDNGTIIFFKSLCTRFEYSRFYILWTSFTCVILYWSVYASRDWDSILNLIMMMHKKG